MKDILDVAGGFQIIFHDDEKYPDSLYFFMEDQSIETEAVLLQYIGAL